MHPLAFALDRRQGSKDEKHDATSYRTSFLVCVLQASTFVSISLAQLQSSAILLPFWNEMPGLHRQSRARSLAMFRALACSCWPSVAQLAFAGLCAQTRVFSRPVHLWAEQYQGYAPGRSLQSLCEPREDIVCGSAPRRVVHASVIGMRRSDVRQLPCITLRGRCDPHALG